MMIRRTQSRARFPDFREINARFDSDGTCGHRITKGERIGYAPRFRETQCEACWTRWCAENAEADMLEGRY